MSVTNALSLLALEQLVGLTARHLPGGEMAGDALGGVVALIRRHLTDHSRKLPIALNRSCEKAWVALELALAGDSFWDRLRHWVASADLRAFASQASTLLDVDADFRSACLRELREARRRKLLDGPVDPDALARRFDDLARSASPGNLLQSCQQEINEIAQTLNQNGLNRLALVVAFRPQGQPSLLAMGVRFFFRREVESDPELSRSLTFDQLDNLTEAQQTGFDALAKLLDRHGDQLTNLLAQTHATILDLGEELRGDFRELQGFMREVLARLPDRRSDVSPGDCDGVMNEEERQRIEGVKSRYWSLPETERRRAPALGNAVGKLGVAVGDYDDARRAFVLAAEIAPQAKEKALAHQNAYQTALQQGKWQEALDHLRKSISRGGKDFAPFPVDRYRPERILGAGGFGVAFLCRHARTDAQVVVKTLQGGQVEGGIDSVFKEAQALEQITHPAVIRIRDCDYADPEVRLRPYLVMDYFDGLTLAELVKTKGPLPLPDFIQVAAQIAAGLAATHARNVLHRDVKPGNVLAKQERGRWQVRLIDFGLAHRLGDIQKTARESQLSQNTLSGRSLAGTLDYAAPEQMGRLPGMPISQASDVFAFARTCCYALFGTPHPGPGHWKSLTDERLAKLLDDCLVEDPCKRLNDFAAIRRELLRMTRPPAASPPKQPTPAPSDAETVKVIEPFRFRSGEEARNLTELLGLCEKHWEEAKWHLGEGHFERWLRQAGHGDLAQKAEEVRRSAPTRREAIDTFLEACGPEGQLLVQRQKMMAEATREAAKAAGNTGNSSPPAARPEDLTKYLPYLFWAFIMMGGPALLMKSCSSTDKQPSFREMLKEQSDKHPILPPKVRDR